MKKQPVFMKESELIALGVTGEELAEIKKNPRLGYNPLRSVDLDHVISIQEKPFYIMGEEVGEIAPGSCLKDVMKKGNILVSINGAYFSVLNKTKVFLKGTQVFDKLVEIVKDGEEVEITFLSEVRTDKNTEMSGIPVQRKHRENKANVKVHYFYEVTDQKLILKIERSRILKLPSEIKSRLFNQDHAVDKVFKSIKLYFTQLKEENKPIGGYLMVGPTGTGKTELATLYAKQLGFNLVRIDMSEYSEKHTVSRLIGSPAGYVGYGDQTILEKEIGNDGKKIVLLFDEMEKAHPDLQKILLQALDNSRITLANGSEVNFCNTLILMTSNLGTVVKTSMGLGSDPTQGLLTVDMGKVKGYFLPEFWGRLSGIIQFNPLSLSHAHIILDKFVLEFNEKQMSNKNAHVVLSQNAKDHLVSIGFDKMYGARPLKNALQGEIYEKIADLYLFEDEPTSTILVDYENNEFKASFQVDTTPEIEIPEVPASNEKKGFLSSFLSKNN